MARVAARADTVPTLLIISEHPEFYATLRPGGREVHQWRRRLLDGAPPDGVRLFAGAPEDPETYGAMAAGAGEVTAVVDIRGSSRAEAVIRALRAVRPDTAVLVLAHEEWPALPAGVVGRRVAWSELFGTELEVELGRLEIQRRVHRLRGFAEGARLLPILLQKDPDPDGIASALAIRVLLRRREATCPIVSFGQVTRPENRRMAELLHVRVTRVTEAELRAFERVIAVDVQPVALAGAATRVAVIDHHPPESGYSAEVADIRPEYGATASMLTEYLRAEDGERISRRIATALLYGIQTDTALLTRGVIAEDVEAYAFLQERADLALLRRISRPAYPASALRAFGRALSGLQAEDELAVASLGTLPPERAHMLADLADFCLSLEGIGWVAVSAFIGGELVITLRHQGAGPGAGVLARRLAGEEGVGGGHASMARLVLPGPVARRRFGRRGGAPAAHALAELVRTELDRLR